MEHAITFISGALMNGGFQSLITGERPVPSMIDSNYLIDAMGLCIRPIDSESVNEWALRGPFHCLPIESLIHSLTYKKKSRKRFVNRNRCSALNLPTSSIDLFYNFNPGLPKSLG